MTNLPAHDVASVPARPAPEMQPDGGTPLAPVIQNLSQAERIQILLAAHQKHAAELLAIEGSQEKLTAVLLGIYSARLTLITATLAKDAKPFLQTAGHPSHLAWALVVLAIILGWYALVMTKHRGEAREAVREGLSRIDHALAFFEPNLYLKDATLYPPDWQTFAKKTWLNWSIAIVIIAGTAFVAAVLIIGFS